MVDVNITSLENAYCLKKYVMDELTKNPAIIAFITFKMLYLYFLNTHRKLKVKITILKHKLKL